MSWLGRLFGAKTPPPPSSPPNSVLIDDELAAQLTSEGVALDLAVDTALRSYLDAQAKSAAVASDDERIPFWLRRDQESGDIDDELRDRMIQRQAADEAETDTTVKRTQAKQVELGGG